MVPMHRRRAQRAVDAHEPRAHRSQPPPQIVLLELQPQRLEGAEPAGSSTDADGVPQRVRRLGAVPAAQGEPRRPAGKSGPAIQRCTRDSRRATEPRTAPVSRSLSRSMWLQKSSFRATTISAAAEGVGARTSAAKSAIVKSTSWPTAEMIGNRRGDDGPRHDFFVERPQIFDRAASAPDDDDVDARHLDDVLDAAGDFGRGALSLHARGANDEMRVRIPSAEHFDDVANRRAVERRDDADFAGQGRERALARGVEQPLGLEPPLQLIEGELQCAEAMRLHALAHDLVFALGLVDADAAADDRRAGHPRA